MDANTFSPPAPPTAAASSWNGLGINSSVVIVGAGAFGGWTALHLLRAGFRVTLVDAWGAGNSRSSSGDETRVIRSTYGDNEFYFNLNVRALELWKNCQQQWNKPLFHNTGVVWFCYQEKTPLVDDSIPFAVQHKMEYDYLSVADLKKRYPIVNTTDLHHGWFDPFGGYLKARESCQAVAESFVREGGSLVQAYARHNTEKNLAELSTGAIVTADLFIYACGPWLGQLFPTELGNLITCTKQEAYYFGVPAAHAAAFDQFPVWVDVDGDDYYYGIPGNASRGFKLGVDKRGERFDPTHGDRVVNPAVLEKARAFIGHRFPPLKSAPLAESRVCPYENSPDGNFILRQHSQAANVWFLGGGSGHGFKHGPSLGELVMKVVKGEKPFSLF